MRKLIQLKLKILAKLILAKYEPEIVGVTGSVGKTSAKNAIYSVLKTKYNARKNIKNYNNEIGLPLTIIGVKSPGKNLFGWVGVFLRALYLIIVTDKKYPEVLVLEMGIDRPGDMKYLMSIAKARVGVITTIGQSHLEYFGTVENVRKEKGVIIDEMEEGGIAVFNADDPNLEDLIKKREEKSFTFGFDEKADFQARNARFNFVPEGNNEKIGTNFEIKFGDKITSIFLKGALGTPPIYSSLIAAAVGMAFDMSMDDISKSITENFELPKGRLKLLPGIKNTLIIDDTYNSSPQSSRVALDILRDVPVSEKASKFAVLGDMLELGSISEEEHKKIGKYAVSSGIGYLVTVGSRSRAIAHGAEEAGLNKDNIYNFSDSAAAGKFIQERIGKGDLILVKGSQGVRMEKVVLEIMADPTRAKELLVRQGSEWKNV